MCKGPRRRLYESGVKVAAFLLSLQTDRNGHFDDGVHAGVVETGTRSSLKSLNIRECSFRYLAGPKTDSKVDHTPLESFTGFASKPEGTWLYLRRSALVSISKIQITLRQIKNDEHVGNPEARFKLRIFQR